MTRQRRRSLKPWLIIWRTSSRLTGTLTTFSQGFFRHLVSSTASASNRLRRPFSVTSSFKRLASDTFTPPNFCAKGSSWPLRIHAFGRTRLRQDCFRSRRKPMICSYLYSFFTSNLLLHWIGLQHHSLFKYGWTSLERAIIEASSQEDRVKMPPQFILQVTAAWRRAPSSN